MDPIEQYKMTGPEIAAYRVCMIWEEKVQKFFPDYSHTKMKRGDPRKSLVFKIAYKLCREKKGILSETDYPLYIHAQLDILKHLSKSGFHPLISPNCLVGEKAWKRWILWKIKYEKIKETKTTPIKIPNSKILEALEKTKEFLSANIDFTEEQYKNNSDKILMWIKLGKISPYYIVLSPFIKSIIPQDKINSLNIDINMYKSGITPEIERIFKDKFSWEFT